MALIYLNQQSTISHYGNMDDLCTDENLDNSSLGDKSSEP